MNPIKAIELERKKIANGHVIITYQAGDFVYYNEYQNEQEADEKSPQKVLSKSYIQKQQNGGFMHIYVHPQNPSLILKTLNYDSNNHLSTETHFYENKNKSLIRFFTNGVLTHAWSYAPNGKVKLGTYYQKNNQNKYDITHLSKPVFDNEQELSHFVMLETTAEGKPTGKITQRTFYLLDKPSIRVDYNMDLSSGLKSETIYSNENGKWILVTDQMITSQLKEIFKEMIALESPRTVRLTLEKSSNIIFEELYYQDVLNFKKTHPDLHVFIPQNQTPLPKQPPMN